MNTKIFCNNDWQFFEKFENSLLENSNNSDFQLVRIPHTCKILPFNYFDESLYQMVCAYKKVFTAPKEWQGKKIFITFEGVAHQAQVFLNGKLLFTHNCGYTAFSVDLTQDISFEKENILVVKVNSREDLNVPPFGNVIDYMTYGGIYRDAYFEIKEKIYFTDVYLKPLVNIEKNVTNLASEFSVNEVAENLSVVQSISVHKKNEFQKISQFSINNEISTSAFDLQDIKLWSTEEPNLYDVKNELFLGSEKLDEKTICVGFRQAQFKKDGFFLNGKKLKIRGLNRHQSYPYVGYAMPKSMQEFDAEVLKNELGLNAVRTSHYPQSHYFIEKCDELGLLVFTEIPGWQYIGNAEWRAQAVQNVREMVTQYRNHASIVIWGVRINESKDDDEFYKETNKVCHELDSTRPTGGVKAHKKAHTFEDVYNYNDFSHSGANAGCEPKKNVVPDMNLPYLVTEYNGHMFPTKTFDCEEHRRDHALRHARVLDSVASYDDICGSFGWCMADYNTHKDFGSGDRICYHGVLDMFRNPKMAAYVYACQQEKTPVLEVGSSMDIGEHPACFRGSTYIFTNADSVKMYKNERFIKEYKKTDSEYKNLAHGPILIDDFVGNAIEENENFSKKQAESVKTILNLVACKGMNFSGTLVKHALRLVLVYHMNPNSAVGYFNKYIGDWGGKSTSYRFEAIKDGKVVKVVKKSTMQTVHLNAIVNSNVLKEENTYDVASVRIQALDDLGNVLSFFNEPVELSTEGPIEIVGPKLISLKGGLFGTYVKSCGKAGEATLTIKCANAQPLKVAFTVEI